MDRIIDVHCHLFNGGYALAEFASATWNIFRGSYPYPGAGAAEAMIRPRSVTRQEGTKSFAGYVGRLLDVVVSDSPGNYRTLKKSLEKSAMAGRELTIVPLMMDIYYALDDNGQGEGRPHSAGEEVFLVEEGEEKAFEAHLEKVRAMVLREMDVQLRARGHSLEITADPVKRLDSELDKLRMNYREARETRRAPYSYRGLDLSPGYRNHMKALEDLARVDPERILPLCARHGR